MKSLRAVSDNAIDLMETDKSGFKVIERQPVKLGGIRATRIRGEYDDYNSAHQQIGKVIEEEIVALRAGIIYEIGLRTTAAHYPADKTRLKKLLADFRFWKIHYC